MKPVHAMREDHPAEGSAQQTETALWPREIEVIDSHTEGEPTRVVVRGWPEPQGATMAARRDTLARDFDHLRRAVVHEPRGHEAMVGALLTSPVSPDSDAGVI